MKLVGAPGHWPARPAPTASSKCASSYPAYAYDASLHQISVCIVSHRYMHASYRYIPMWNTKIGYDIIPDLRIYRYRTWEIHDIRWDMVTKSHIVAPRNVFLPHRVRYHIRCRRLLRYRSRYRSANNRVKNSKKLILHPISYPTSCTIFFLYALHVTGAPPIVPNSDEEEDGDWLMIWEIT